MKRNSRYHRFEPITVRTATRVVHMGSMGRVSPQELGYYLRELAAMDSYAGPRAENALGRIAARRSSLGRTGAPGVFRMARQSRQSLPGGRKRSRTGAGGIRVQG